MALKTLFLTRGPLTNTERTLILAALVDNSSQAIVPFQSQNTYSFQSSYWNRVDTHTFRGQANKVYKRDDLIDLKRRDPKTGFTNRELMMNGKAPNGPDGKPLNLHHTIQTSNGPIAEVTETFHNDYSKIIHINPKSTPSGISRTEFDKWRESYWKARIKELEG